MKKVFLFCCFVTGSIVLLHAQDKSQLEKEREELRHQIDEIQGVYDQLKGQKKETLGQLSLIQRKLNLQDRYVNTINKEIRGIDDDIYLSALEIIRLQHQLDTLKKQYARSIVYAYKNKSNFGYLNFVFSAASFNDALKRLQYLKSYRTFREQQVANIVQTQKLIEIRKQSQLTKKAQKSEALKDQAKQLAVLEDQKKEKDRVMYNLKSQEKDIKKQLADRRKRDNQLKNSIASIIRREIEEARRKAKAEADAEAKANAAKKAATTPAVTNPSTTNPGNSSAENTTSVTRKPVAESKPIKSALDYTAKDVALNSSFEKNKRKLPWPVDKGYVGITFGRNVVNGLGFDSPGISIITPSSGASVKSVFDGEVAAVYNLGDAMAVTIRHGKYFTTYSNLSSVSVSKKDIVQTGQIIGKNAQAEEGTGGQVDFILMIETKNVNPEPWLHP
ncbi:MAG: peptidoglycan DD-metalloendopeptidase family protein [Bacteroidetes bacterium]|nr:peptidoglycan DD-metalloendopeptidase family protein [Bacteroidota bacterium]